MEAIVKEHIRKHFTYDPSTGDISRSDRKNSNGSLDKDGYLIIKIKTIQYKAHRLAWFLYYGNFPAREIDHINRIKTDNRIENLRDVSRTINVNNVTRRPNAITNISGIYFDKTHGLKKNYAFKHKDKTYRYYTLEEAIKERSQKKEL